MDFSDKIVLITGASSGIGAACAVTFAKLFAKLILVGRNLIKLHQVANQCKLASKNKPYLITADISKDIDVERIINETIECYGRIDVLINNAGIMLTDTEHEIQLFDRIMATNLRGTYFLTSKAIPHLVQSKGNVVNISSILSTTPNAILTPYCMSKAALDMFTKCLAAELGPRDVRANAVNPGPVQTELFKNAGMSEEETHGFFTLVKQASPLKKLVDAAAVADLVVFLASDKAKYITGCCYLIDSGLTVSDANNA